MTAPGSAREALIAEALGELGRLLDRQEALLPALDAATRALQDAQGQLAGRLAALDAEVVAVGDRIKMQATRGMLARADIAGQQLASTHAQALAEAGRAVLRSEIAPALRALLDEARRPHRRWLAPAVAVLTALACTLLVQARGLGC